MMANKGTACDGMRDNRRIPALRLILILLAVAICAIASYWHVKSFDGTFEYRLEDFEGTRVSANDIRINPPAMGRIRDIRYDGKVPVVRFEATQEGDGTVMVAGDTSGGMFQMRVTPGSTIIMDGANFMGWEAVGWSLVICFAVAFTVLLWNSIWLWRRSWYDYGMIAYLGSALFCGFQLFTFMKIMLADRPRQFMDLSFAILMGSERFLLLLIPLMAVIASLFAISNIILVRHEGLRPTNLLGIIMSLALVVGCVTWRVLGALEFESFDAYLLAFKATSLVSVTLSYGLCLFLGTCVCSFLAARHRPSMPRDYVIILGCGLRPDGTLTPLLAGRVDAAREFAEEQAESGWASPTLVPSGGQGQDEICSEAEAMRRYLVQNGMDDSLIVKEDESTSTRENFLFASKVIAEASESDSRAVPSPVAFSTTNYHVLRGYIHAHEAGISAEGIAAPTKGYFWPNAFLREFAGVLVARLAPIAMGLVTCCAIYSMAQQIVLMG